MKEVMSMKNVTMPKLSAKTVDQEVKIILETMYARPSQISELFSLSVSELSRHISHLRRHQNKDTPVVLTLGPRLTLINIRGFERYLISKNEKWLKEA